jgi:hypothetical protein
MILSHLLCGSSVLGPSSFVAGTPTSTSTHRLPLHSPPLLFIALSSLSVPFSPTAGLS